MSDLVTGMPGRLAIVLTQVGVLQQSKNELRRQRVITGNFSFREAKMLSDILNNPLKYPSIGEQYEVSPTLAAGASVVCHMSAGPF